MGEKLPEPAYRFAKEASLRVTEMERGLQTLAEELTRLQADFDAIAGDLSESRLRERGEQLLSSAKKLLSSEKQVLLDLERFKDALKKAAASYDDVGTVYTDHASKARSKSVKEDYGLLAEVYLTKASGVAKRAKELTISSDVKEQAEVVEEGNLFVERLLETLSDSAAEVNGLIVCRRLGKHGARCSMLAERLSEEVKKILGGPGPSQNGKKTGDGRKSGSVPVTVKELSAKRPGEVSPGKGKEFDALVDAGWSCPITVQGTRCLQVVRFGREGKCQGKVYLLEGSRKGGLVASASTTFRLAESGILSFFQGGTLVERGIVTLLRKDQWVYEILENSSAPQLAGTRLTFIREEGRWVSPTLFVQGRGTRPRNQPMTQSGGAPP
jgi:hypothetical protein